MADYKAPIAETSFVLNELFDINSLTALPGFEDATPDLIEAVIKRIMVKS